MFEIFPAVFVRKTYNIFFKLAQFFKSFRLVKKFFSSQALGAIIEKIWILENQGILSKYWGNIPPEEVDS